MNKFTLFILLSVFFPLSFLFAQTEEAPAYWEKGFSIRFGVGGAHSYLDMNIDKGILNGEVANIIRYEEDTEYPNFAANFAIKYGIWKWLSIGVSLDYNYTPIELKLYAESTNVIVRERDTVARLHLFSMYSFLELRIPIPIDEKYLFPYFQVGVGVNANISGRRQDLAVDEASAGVYLSGGFEYVVGRIGVFIETKWRHNYEDFIYRTNDAKFEGRMNIDRKSVV